MFIISYVLLEKMFLLSYHIILIFNNIDLYIMIPVKSISSSTTDRRKFLTQCSLTSTGNKSSTSFSISNRVSSTGALRFPVNVVAWIVDSFSSFKRQQKETVLSNFFSIGRQKKIQRKFLFEVAGILMVTACDDQGRLRASSATAPGPMILRVQIFQIYF